MALESSAIIFSRQNKTRLYNGPPETQEPLSNTLKSSNSFSLDPHPFKGQTNHTTPRDEAFHALHDRLPTSMAWAGLSVSFQPDGCARYLEYKPARHGLTQRQPRSPPPEISPSEGLSTGIDALPWMLWKKGFETVTSGKATLIRRVTFDLIGLPPTPEAVNAFVQDEREAHGELVEKLLKDPRYGRASAFGWIWPAMQIPAGCEGDPDLPRLGVAVTMSSMPSMRTSLMTFSSRSRLLGMNLPRSWVRANYLWSNQKRMSH